MYYFLMQTLNNTGDRRQHDNEPRRVGGRGSVGLACVYGGLLINARDKKKLALIFIDFEVQVGID